MTDNMPIQDVDLMFLSIFEQYQSEVGGTKFGTEQIGNFVNIRVSKIHEFTNPTKWHNDSTK